MSNHSVIEHRANYHFARIEEDYIAICLKGEASPHCKALILAILESWTNTKRSNGEEPIVYMTYPQWVQAMYWQHGRNAIIESLEELEKQGFIIRKPYRFKGKDTFAYVLNAQAVQECIKALPEKADGEYLPRFNLNAFKNKRVPNQTRPKSNANAVYNQTPDAFNNIPFIDSSPQLQDITSEEERGASPHVDATAPAFSENESHSYRHDHTRKEDAWNCHNWCVAQDKTCADYQAYIESGAREETPTEPRTPAIQIGAPNERAANYRTPSFQGGDAHGGDAIGAINRDHHLSNALSPHAQDEERGHEKEAIHPQVAMGATDGHHTPDHPATDHRATDSVRPDSTGEPTTETHVEQTTSKSQVQRPPAASGTDGAATVRSSGEPRASGKPKRQRKKPVEEPEPIPQEVLRILDDWDALQKKPVPRTDRLVASAKTLVCRNPTREELKGCRDWLPTTDRPGKPWYRLHGVGLWDIAEKIGQWDSLEGMSIEPAPLADMTPKKPMDIYTQASLDPARTERNLEKLRQRRLAREAAAQQQGGVN